MKNYMNTQTPKDKKNKGISITALIVCFIIACGIWLYAQAVNDDINIKTYNQLPVECVGEDVFTEATGFDVHSLAVKNANITISGTNRELVKFDAQNICLVADVGTANNGVATIKAFYIDDDGNRTELKNYEVTPAVVTVNIAKQVDYTIIDITTEKNDAEFTYSIDQAAMHGTITLIGSLQDLAEVGTVKFDLDYKTVANIPGAHPVSASAITFYDEKYAPLFVDSDKNENIKYDATGITVIVTVESKTDNK